MLVKTFSVKGTFESLYSAREWCSENGYSCGSLCRDEPVGLKKGDYVIAKWKNMDDDDITLLDGRMTSTDFREGSVTITIK